MPTKTFRLNAPCTAELFLEMFQDGTREWRGEVTRLTPEMLQWQPVPDGHSIGAIMLHIADAEVYWIQQVGAGKKMSQVEKERLMSEETMVDDYRWPEPPNWSAEEYFAILEDVRARTIKTVTGWKDLSEMRDVDLGGRPFRFSLGWILHHVVTHESYHGGQVALLQLMFKGQKRRGVSN